MAKETKVYLFKTDTTKAGNPVFDGDVAHADVVKTYHQPRIGQWFGDRASLEHGALVPKTLREDYGIKTLPHILSGAIGWVAVSDTVRTIVETLEPGIHAFTPEIQVTYKDGRPSEHRYYGLAWGALLTGTINVERSPWYPKGLNPDRVARKEAVPFYSGSGDNLFAINAEAVAGRHLWVAIDYMDKWFCSEALREAFRAHKVRNLSFYQQGLV
jgi:hypothetical protein